MTSFKMLYTNTMLMMEVILRLFPGLIWIRQHYIRSSLTHFTYYFLIRFNSLRKSPFTEIWRNLHNESKATLKWATKTCNSFFNIAAEHVEKWCCMFYCPCSNLSCNKIIKVAASCKLAVNNNKHTHQSHWRYSLQVVELMDCRQGTG